MQASLVNAGRHRDPVRRSRRRRVRRPRRRAEARATSAGVPTRTSCSAAGWEWVAVEGATTLIGPDDPRPGFDAGRPAPRCSEPSSSPPAAPTTTGTSTTGSWPPSAAPPFSSLLTASPPTPDPARPGARSSHGAISSPSCPKPARSPVGGSVVLEELPVDVGAGVEPGDDRIDDPRRAVDDVERRVEAVLRRLALRRSRTGSSSLTQPVSTLFMWIPSAWYSAAEVRVIMFSAAFAMLVCGCFVVLNRR